MEPRQRIIAELKKAGLSDKAAAVYSCLLELGGAFPSKLAAQTRINRSTVYKILTDLSIKGLVNEIERGRKIYYQVENPKKLVRLAERQAESANERLEYVKELFPELQGYFAAQDNKPRVLYFEGVDGVFSIYDDQIAVGKPYEMVSFANTSNVLDFLDEKYYRKYRKRKVELGITTRGILPADKKSLTMADTIYSDVPARYRPQIRYLAPEDFPFKGEIIVYSDNKVAITNLDAHHLSGIIIEDKALHLMMRSIFNLAWKAAETKNASTSPSSPRTQSQSKRSA